MSQNPNNASERILDEMLVERCRQGDRRCFDLLIRRWQPRLWRYARSLTDGDETAWDVMQDAWIDVLKRIRKLRDPAWFHAWACRIVRCKCADHCRCAVRRRNLAQNLAQRRSEQNAPDPAEQNDADRTAAVADALRKLPHDKRELLTLKYGQCLGVTEIAAVLGVPPGTVKSRLHHARALLKEILEGEPS